MTVEELRRSVEDHLSPETRMTAFLDVARWVMARVASFGDRLGGWSFDFTKGALNTEASYETGTIDVTQSSTAVTGNSTVWTGITLSRHKMDIGGVHYPITTITDDTNIVLTDAYAGDDDTAIGYTIFLDEYSLAAARRIHVMWDADSDRRILGVPRKMVGRAALELNSGNDPLWYALMGRNASTNASIVQFAPYPTSIMRIEYWYQADYTRIAGIGDTIDMPSYMDECLKQGALYRQMQLARMDGYRDQELSFAQMLREAWYLDRPQAEKKIRLVRSDCQDWNPQVYLSARTVITS